MNRGITAEIDLDAAAHNIRLVSNTVRGLPVIAVVKADAYGHGAVEVSRSFEAAGAKSLAVAFVSEAKELREAGLGLPILVLFDRTQIPDFFDLNLTPVIHDYKTAKAFSNEASKRNSPIELHLKVDTGMGRMGILEQEDILRTVELPGIKITGLLSHFSEADLEDRDKTDHQLRLFNETRVLLKEKGISPLCHIANSAAVLSCPESHLDAVRPGIVLYGCLPFERESADIGARPVMKASTRILALRRLKAGTSVSYGGTFITKRDTLAAVLAVGYADGYSRAFSNRSHVLIKGRRAPVIGRVCMDLTVVDVTEIDDVEENQSAVLMGTDGDETINAWELASIASTIPYEVLLWFGRSSRRVYNSSDIGATN